MSFQSHSWAYIQKKKPCNLKEYMHPGVHSSTIHNSQNMEATYMVISRWVDKDVEQVYGGLLLSHKMNETMPFATTWIDLEIITLSEVSQRQISYNIT